MVIAHVEIGDRLSFIVYRVGMVGHCQIDYLLVTSLGNCLELVSRGLSSSADARCQLYKISNRFNQSLPDRLSGLSLA